MLYGAHSHPPSPVSPERNKLSMKLPEPLTGLAIKKKREREIYLGVSKGERGEENRGEKEWYLGFVFSTVY